MKKLIFIFLSLTCINSGFAGNAPGLRVKITGTNQHNKYFLCVTNVGCVSIFSGNNGKKFPLDAGQVNYIFVANASNLRMYTQTLPQSCKITVNKNQTLTISGHLIKEINGKNAYIKNLECSLNP